MVQKNTSFLKKYIEYLNDNPQGYWFKRKLYGWGWAPAKKEGWMVTLMYLASLILLGMWMGSRDATPENLSLFFTVLIAATIAIIAICWNTGERPHWMWGKISINSKS